MKVVLIKDTPKIGRKGDVKNVSDGHAYNFLFPQGIAKEATPKVLAEIEAGKANREATAEASKQAVKDLFSQVAGKEIVVTEKVNEKGHLFAGLHAKEISARIKSDLGVDLQENMIKLDEPIKEVGEYEVALSNGDEKGVLKVKVEAGK
jgi:large subunit ribosomal protein L9